MGAGGKGNIIKALEELDKKDIYSLILFSLYKLKDCPEYSTLSELIYILDNENFIKFINYYGGKTIKVPTINDLSILIHALMVFERLNNTNVDIDTILKELAISKKEKKEILESIQIIQETLANYDFKR